MRKYQETQDYWVYGHITPNGMIYIGMSKQQPCKRWRKTNYKTESLTQYIEKYGWENIQHKVFVDGLTKEQAETLEDLLILQATADNWCINKQRSGGIKRDDIKAYHKQYDKQRLSTPEWKIYNRVAAYNQRHPDKAIETQMEAKRKYLEWGYIPAYIKNDDLI